LLRANDGEEYINPPNQVRARNLVSAIVHGKYTVEAVITWINTNKSDWLTDEQRAFYLAQEAYETAAERTARMGSRGGDTGAGGSNEPRTAMNLSMSLKDIYQKGARASAFDENWKPIKPTAFQAFTLEGDIRIDPNADELPEGLKTPDFFNTIDSLAETNGSDCYDAETFTLGMIEDSEYMLFPNSMKWTEVDNNVVCCSFAKQDPNPIIMAMIYALNKEQARSLGMSDEEQIKWGVIRCQAYAAGWFAGQRYTRYATPPTNSIEVWKRDWPEIAKYKARAWKLVGFLPFCHELSFRQSCSTWTLASSADYEKRVKAMAQSANCSDAVELLPGKWLHKSALRWIGIRKVMGVLKRTENRQAIHRIFDIRSRACPAGQAVLSAAAAVIKHMEAAGCWQAIKAVTKWSDENILTQLPLVTADPYKYHLMFEAYGIDPPTAAERTANKNALTDAEIFAPILQAYAVIYLANDPISKNKVLNKFAVASGAIYQKYKKFFRYCNSQEAKSIAELFGANQFGVQDPNVPVREKKRRRRRRDETSSDDEEYNIPE
jgi:hypothetical protein